MFKKIKENKAIILVILIGIILSTTIAYIILTSNRTIQVWVPNKTITAGTIVTSDMIKQIDLPANVSGNYITQREKIVNYRLKNTVEAGQLLYPNNFLESMESYSKDIDIPDDFVVTSIQVPNQRACGGLIVPGDTIDIMGIDKDGSKAGFKENTKSNINGRENIGVSVYYILSNVRVLNTNSPLSESQGTELGEILNEGKKNEGQYYIVALSYDDCKKLRQAEGLLELWLNIAPKQNLDNPPLIAQMIGQSWSGLHDAQQQVANPDGSPIDGVPQVVIKEGENTPGYQYTTPINPDEYLTFEEYLSLYQENPELLQQMKDELNQQQTNEK